MLGVVIQQTWDGHPGLGAVLLSRESIVTERLSQPLSEDSQRSLTTHWERTKNKQKIAMLLADGGLPSGTDD